MRFLLGTFNFHCVFKAYFKDSVEHDIIKTTSVNIKIIMNEVEIV